MSAAVRIVMPELLDNLAPSDPAACRSRRDLRRVHRAMRSVSILKHAITRLQLAAPPRRVLELGAGDGSLLLRVAQAMKPRWSNVTLTLLDRHNLVSAATRAGYEALEWNVTVVREDVRAWAVERDLTRFDLCVTCLFMHHFDSEVLVTLMRAVALSANAFVACEPRRNSFARIGSGLVGVLGANRVTREDAVTSVGAGFTRRELTALWPHVDTAWSCEEYPAFPFSHCFTAVLNSVRRN